MRRSVALPAGAELDEVLPLPYPEPCRGCGETGETQLLLRIPRKLIGRRTPADKLKPWPLCTACIPSLPARIRERLPKDDDVSDETPTPTETQTETQTSTQRASKAASRAAKERAAETARHLTLTSAGDVSPFLGAALALSADLLAGVAPAAADDAFADGMTAAAAARTPAPRG